MRTPWVPILLSSLALLTVAGGVAVGHFYWTSLRSSMGQMANSMSRARERQRDLLVELNRTQALMSFFTIGKDQCRAWTIKTTDNAFTAAGKIHTDIQQGFIRAETIDWKDFLDAGGFSQAQKKGVLRLEGKEYIPKDGEILHFRFNK